MSTQVIDPTAKIGEGTTIGEYSIIDKDVTIGAGCRIGSCRLYGAPAAAADEYHDDHARERYELNYTFHYLVPFIIGDVSKTSL